MTTVLVVVWAPAVSFPADLPVCFFLRLVFAIPALFQQKQSLPPITTDDTDQICGDQENKTKTKNIYRGSTRIDADQKSQKFITDQRGFTTFLIRVNQCDQW
jgi:hypothetical protein